VLKTFVWNRQDAKGVKKIQCKNAEDFAFTFIPLGVLGALAVQK
jgi:hypothetical protein